MAISLNNHNTRIQSLENKFSGISSGSAVLVNSYLSAKGYAEFSNGLIINWGTTTSNPEKFYKPYKSAIWVVVCTPTAGGSQAQESDGVVAMDTNGFRSEILGGRGYTQGRYVAFGL